MVKKRRSTTKSRRLPPPPGGVPGVPPTITLNKGVEKGYSRTGDANVDQRKKAFLSRRNEGILLLLMLTLIITGAYVAIKFSETKASGGGLRDIIQKGGVREEDGVITNSDGTLTTLAYVLIPLFFILVAGAFVTNWRAIMDWFMGMMPKKIPAPQPAPRQPTKKKMTVEEEIEEALKDSGESNFLSQIRGNRDGDYYVWGSANNLKKMVKIQDLYDMFVRKVTPDKDINNLEAYLKPKYGKSVIISLQGQDREIPAGKAYQTGMTLKDINLI